MGTSQCRDCRPRHSPCAAAYSPRCCAWSPLPVGWHDGGIRDGMPQRDEQIEAGRTAVESVLLVRPRSATKLLEGVPWQEGECRGGAGTASDPREGKWFGHARQIRGDASGSPLPGTPYTWMAM